MWVLLVAAIHLRWRSSRADLILAESIAIFAWTITAGCWRALWRQHRCWMMKNVFKRSPVIVYGQLNHCERFDTHQRFGFPHALVIRLLLSMPLHHCRSLWLRRILFMVNEITAFHWMNTIVCKSELPSQWRELAYVNACHRHRHDGVGCQINSNWYGYVGTAHLLLA